MPKRTPTPLFWANALLAVGALIFLIAMLVTSSQDAAESPAVTTPALPTPALPTPALPTASVPAHVPPLPVPANNPITASKVALGRRLFYERALSFNHTIACADCHQQAKAFTDGRTLSPGATGELTRRNAMSLTNVAYNAAFTWADGTITTLEQQAMLPLTLEHPIEMGITGHEAEVLARLQDDAVYRAQFSEAFPQGNPAVTLENVVKALASFQRTLLSYASPYDRDLAGDSRALSAAARRGRELFFSNDLNCFRCHGGHNFRFTLGTRQGEDDTRVAFHNTGLYNIDDQGSYPLADRGLLEITGLPSDMGRFKAPTLRNIALTAPYMHDGSVATLEEVLAHYAQGGRVIESGPNAGDGSRNPYKSELLKGFTLSDEDTAAVIAFLDSLTDEEFISNPAFSQPATVTRSPD